MTTWSVIFLTPYFLYRSIDRRWGKYGRRIATLVVVLLNVLTITFFAYEKYVLHHYSSQNFQQNIQSEDRSTLPVQLGGHYGGKDK